MFLCSYVVKKRNMKAQKENTLYSTTYKSPVGMLSIAASDKGIMAVSFEKKPHPLPLSKGEGRTHISKCVKQLDEYFSGKRKNFELEFDLHGTDFQKKVWKQLTKIPYGKTVSYGYIANKAGNAKASRAVGNANNKNCIAIVIPCHRVIGSNGKMVGYAGGLNKKEWLLKFEKDGSDNE